jgi:hypothetical protein
MAISATFNLEGIGRDAIDLEAGWTRHRSRTTSYYLTWITEHTILIKIYYECVYSTIYALIIVNLDMPPG